MRFFLAVARTMLVLLVSTHLALSSFVVLRPLMLDIMAGMDQRTVFCEVFGADYGS